MTSNNEKILTRDFVVLFIVNLMMVLIQFMFLTTMAVFAMEHFHVDGSIGGITASIFMIGAVIGRVLSAHYANTLNLRKYCFITLVGQLIACIAYLASDVGIGFLLTIRVIHGLSFGIANTVVPALAIDSLPRSRIGEGTGYFFLSTSIGVGFGPFMTIITALDIDYYVLFVVAIAMAVVSLVLSFFIRPTAVEIAAREQAKLESPSHTKQKWSLATTFDLSTITISVFIFFIAFANSSLTSFVSGYAAELDWAVFAPLLFLVSSVALLVTRPFAGKLMDKYGENVVLYPSIISVGISCALAACAFNPIMLVSCGIFMATGFGVSNSVGQAVAAKESTCGNTSLTVSTFYLMCDFGIGLGPFFLGFIVESAGYQAMYWQCVVVALIALVYYHIAHGRKQTKQRNQAA